MGVASLNNFKFPQIDSAAGRLRFGLAELDAALGGGLKIAALHEVRAAAAEEAAAAAGFALLLAGLAAGFARPVFWIAAEMAHAEAGAPYGPGLAALGLDPGLLVRVAARKLDRALWAAGEVARSGAGICLLELRGNPARAGLGFSRRLALAGKANGLPVFLLRQSGEEEAGAAASRWAIRPAVSGGSAAGPSARWLGPPAFEAILEKSRSGRTGRFLLEWNCHERRFAARRSNGRPDTADRPALPVAASAAACDRPIDAPGPRPALALRSA